MNSRQWEKENTNKLKICTLSDHSLKLLRRHHLTMLTTYPTSCWPRDKCLITIQWPRGYQLIAIYSHNQIQPTLSIHWLHLSHLNKCLAANLIRKEKTNAIRLSTMSILIIWTLLRFHSCLITCLCLILITSAMAQILTPKCQHIRRHYQTKNLKWRWSVKQKGSWHSETGIWGTELPLDFESLSLVKIWGDLSK